jgi:inner membrane protein
MDSLTQIVLGAAVGEAALGKKVGNKAPLWGAIAGTIPDLDVFVGQLYGNPVDWLEVHRGFSHSIVFSILLAPLLGWFIHWIYRKSNEATVKEWAWLAFLGLVTHPILDAFTTWGTQLFWPFNYRVAFNSVFVIDPLYTIPFMVFVIWAMFKKRDSKIRRKLNYIGIGISTFYLFFGLMMKQVANANFADALDKNHISYSRSVSKPMPLTSFYWTIVAESKTEYHIGYYSIFGNKKIDFNSVPKQHYLLKKYGLHKHPELKRLLFLTKGYYTLEETEEGLLINDLRYGSADGLRGEKEKKFIFSYYINFDKSNPKKGIEIKQKRGGLSLTPKEFSGYWDLVFGG